MSITSFDDGIRPLRKLLDFGMNQGPETSILVLSWDRYRRSDEQGLS